MNFDEAMQAAAGGFKIQRKRYRGVRLCLYSLQHDFVPMFKVRADGSLEPQQSYKFLMNADNAPASVPLESRLATDWEIVT